MSEQVSVAHNNLDYAKALPEGERNWGFMVKETEAPHVLHPLDSVLTGENETAQLVEGWLDDGSIRLLAPTLEADPDNLPAGVLPRYLTLSITQTEYDEKVKRGLIPPNENKYGSKVAYFNPEDTTKKGLHKAFPEKMREVAIRDFTRWVNGPLEQSYNIPEDMEELPGILQFFEVDNGYDRAQIYNFSETLLTGEQLQQAINAVREIDERSGGTLMNRLKSISILPEDYPGWGKAQENGEEVAGRSTGRADNKGHVRINEWLLKNRKTQVNQSIPENPFSVEGDSLEAVLVHELTHVVERKDSEENPAKQYGSQIGYDMDPNATIDPASQAVSFVGDKHFPFAYGGKDRHEDAAETGTAQFVGGEWAAQIDDMRKFALEAVYARQHSGRHGPTYIRCNEIDLNGLDYKIGSRLPHNFTFQLFPQISIRKQ